MPKYVLKERDFNAWVVYFIGTLANEELNVWTHVKAQSLTHNVLSKIN